MSKETTCLGLTSLRGIAALAVVVQHCLLVLKVAGQDDIFVAATRLDQPWILHQYVMLTVFNGEAAVILFFVLSGLVLTLSIQRDEPLGQHSIVRYWVRRIFRLYPLLICSVVLSASLLTLVPDVAELPGATTWSDRHLHAPVSAVTILKTATGISNTLNVPVWTITIEILVSMIFPVFYFIATRGTALTNTVAFCLLLLLALGSPVSFRHIEVFLVSFFLGPLVLLYGRAFGHWVWAQKPGLRAVTIAVIVVVGLGAKRLIAPEIWNHAPTALVMSAAAAAIVAIVYYGPRTGLLAHPALVRLGDISYGIYLIHFPILITLVRLAAPHVPSQLAPTATLAFHLALAACVIAVTLPLAALSFRILEVPMQNLGRALARTIGFRSLQSKARSV
jgi:peptidoglycan/LPS O-acetylase OafA/YrhL